jgi:hypothetical protein
MKRPRRANGRAGAALAASFLVAVDAMADRLNLDAQLFEILDPPGEISLAANQFHYKHPLFSGENLGLQNVECQVIVAHKTGNDWLINDFPGESK